MDVDGIKPSGADNEKKPEFKDPGRIGRLKRQMYSRATQPAKRPRRTLSPTLSTTPENWQAPETDEGAASTPKPQNSKRSVPAIALIGAAAVFLCTLGIVLFFFLTGSNVVTSHNIDISVNGPRTIDAGETLELQVAVRNDNSATLELADLVVTYPKGTEVLGHIPHNPQQQRIPLGSIRPGEIRNGTVRSIMFGRDGEQQDIQVNLEYRLAGSSALFVAEDLKTVMVSSGTLDIALTTNKQAVAGQALDMTVVVTSNAKTTVRDVLLRATYPFGFAPIEVSPPTQSDGLWLLGDFAPGESRTFRIIGKLDGQTGDTRVFRFLAGTRNTVNTTKIDVVLAELEHELEVTRPFLAMKLEYGDEEDSEDFVARTGEPVSIALRWRNNLDVALSDVIIAATLGGSGLDPFNINVDKGFYRSIDSYAIWDKTTTKGELELIPAGAEGVLLIRLVPRIADDLLQVTDPTITLELHAVGQRLSEDSVPESIQATVSEEFKIATDPSFNARALYFENPLGSVGPLPPKVELETTYGILWEISNTTNLVRDAKITATLPRYVRWVGASSPSVEHLTFNEKEATITWHIGKILPDTGVGERTPRRVAFSLGLVPSTSQVGQSPVLIQNQTLTGVDNFVDLPIELEIDDLNIQLNETDFADVYGVIVP